MTDNAEKPTLPSVVHEPVPLPHLFFWFAYYTGGFLPLFYGVVSIGESGLFAIYLQASAAVWVFGFLFQICERYAWAWICASIWTGLIGLPVLFEVVRRVAFWWLVGMEGPDGAGSPALFMYFLITGAFTLTATSYMLGVLLFYSPLHLRRKARQQEQSELQGEDS